MPKRENPPPISSSLPPLLDDAYERFGPRTSLRNVADAAQAHTFGDIPPQTGCHGHLPAPAPVQRPRSSWAALRRASLRRSDALASDMDGWSKSSKAGAQSSAVSPRSRTKLMTESLPSDKRAFELLGKGHDSSDADVKPTSDFFSALKDAAEQGWLNKRDGNGQTALMHACRARKRALLCSPAARRCQRQYSSYVRGRLAVKDVLFEADMVRSRTHALTLTNSLRWPSSLTHARHFASRLAAPAI